MIRFPERFHASETPGAQEIGVEPNYRESPNHQRGTQVQHVSSNAKHDRKRFDFAALVAALR